MLFHRDESVEATSDYYSHDLNRVLSCRAAPDRAWSFWIRALVTSETPGFRGITFLECMLRDFERRFPELLELVGTMLPRLPWSRGRCMHSRRATNGRKGVTLIGDAAHLMSPCAGEGVNMAMQDELRSADSLALFVSLEELTIERRLLASMAPLRIAVVGAGPAGLTFASVLYHKAKEYERKEGRCVPWQVTLYEAERSLDARRVGGSLDLGRKTGLAALEAAGLFNRFHDFARPEGQEIRLVNYDGETIFHSAGDATPADDRYSPEIDRVDLNRILVESLPRDAIQWNRKLQCVQAHGDGTYELVFPDGATVQADIVVGADGAWSRVRALVTDQTPTYPDVDATFLDIKLRAFNERFPALADAIGKGTLYSFGGGAMLVAQRNRRDVVHVYLGICAPSDWRQHELIPNATSDRERVTILATTLFADWGEQLRALVMAAAESVNRDDDAKKGDEATLLSWPLYAMPVGVRWQHREGVTLIGDAAHLMSPCAGEGVNTAMVDAMELARALARPLAEAPPSLEGYRAAAMTAIAEYERDMFTRVEDPARRSADNLALFFTAPEMTRDHVAQMFGEFCSPTTPGSA